MIFGGITLNFNKEMLRSKLQILMQPTIYMKRGKTKSIKITKYITGEDYPDSAVKIPLKIFKVSMIGLTLPFRRYQIYSHAPA